MPIEKLLRFRPSLSAIPAPSGRYTGLRKRAVSHTALHSHLFQLRHYPEQLFPRSRTGSGFVSGNSRYRTIDFSCKSLLRPAPPHSGNGDHSLFLLQTASKALISCLLLLAPELCLSLPNLYRLPLLHGSIRDHRQPNSSQGSAEQQVQSPTTKVHSSHKQQRRQYSQKRTDT